MAATFFVAQAYALHQQVSSLCLIFGCFGNLFFFPTQPEHGQVQEHAKDKHAKGEGISKDGLHMGSLRLS